MSSATTPRLVQGRHLGAVSRVLAELRVSSPLSRGDLGEATGLSPASVARATTALVDAAYVSSTVETDGAVGRPRYTLALDAGAYAVAGIHLGRCDSTVALADLTGTVIAATSLPHVPGADRDLDAVARGVASLLAQTPGRSPLAAGVIAPWRDIRLTEAEVTRRLHDLLGLDVAAADHVSAIAAAEYGHRRRHARGTTAYVYVRHSAGYVLADRRADGLDLSRPGYLTHFRQPLVTSGPAVVPGLCAAGHPDCVAATVTDEALLGATRRALVDAPVSIGSVEDVLRLAAPAYTAGLDSGLDSGAGTPAARTAADLVRRRAAALGRLAASVRDLHDPDRIVLLGQAFTAFPPALPDVRAAFDAATDLGPMTPEVTRLGPQVQAAAACSVASDLVVSDPLGLAPAAPGGSPAASRVLS